MSAILQFDSSLETDILAPSTALHVPTLPSLPDHVSTSANERVLYLLLSSPIEESPIKPECT